MNILFDTNVVLDVLLDRHPFSKPAVILFTWAEEGIITGFLGATTVTTIFYLATKAVGKNQAEDAVSKLLAIFSIAPVNRSILEAALKTPFIDFEDAVLYQAACQVNTQAIVTRDMDGFKNSKISVYSPDELVKMIQALKLEGSSQT
ncbi:MAG: PIN domain-containing protein [Deltaproteobacteria bacterium]|nr:PIN domain-containing protein [Deltaproteobacteria bacterium]